MDKILYIGSHDGNAAKEALRRLEELAYSTLREAGIECKCTDCDAFGCDEKCIICKGRTSQIVKIAEIIRDIWAR